MSRSYRSDHICGSDDACGNVLLIAKHIVGDTAVSGRVTELSDRFRLHRTNGFRQIGTRNHGHGCRTTMNAHGPYRTKSRFSCNKRVMLCRSWHRFPRSFVKHADRPTDGRAAKSGNHLPPAALEATIPLVM